MRITINLAEDAAAAARTVARRERLSLGEAISELIRRGASAGDPASRPRDAPVPRGRFALLPQRGEAVTPQHVRDLMGSEGI